MLYVGFLIFLLLGYNLSRWRPSMLPLTLVALSPIYQIRLAFGPIPSTYLEAIILGCILGFLRVEKLQVFKKIWAQLASDVWSQLAAALLAVSTIAILWSPDTVTALGLWRAYVVEPVVIFLLLRITRFTDGDRLRFFPGLVLAIGVLTLVAYMQYIGFLGSPEPWVSESPKRVTSIFQFPNALGLYLTPLIGFLIGVVITKSTLIAKQQKALIGITIGAGLMAIGFGFVRGAFLGIIVACLIATLWANKKNKVTIWLATLTLVVIAFLIPATRSQITSIVSTSDTSTDVRMAVWQGTENLLRARPLTGAGIGGFPVVYPEYKLTKHTEALQYPHNYFLNFWNEFGILGLIWSVAFIAALGLTAWRYRNIQVETLEQLCTIGALCSFGAVIAYGLVDVPYFKNDLAILWWMFALFLPAHAIRR